MNPLESEIVAIIATALRVDRSCIRRDSSLARDLGADSLDWVTLIMALEDRFEVDIPDEDANELRTVKQVTDYVLLAIDVRAAVSRPAA